MKLMDFELTLLVAGGEEEAMPVDDFGAIGGGSGGGASESPSAGASGSSSGSSSASGNASAPQVSGTASAICTAVANQNLADYNSQVASHVPSFLAPSSQQVWNAAYNSCMTALKGFGKK